MGNIAVKEEMLRAETLRAERLEIVDEKGRPRITLQADGDHPRLQFFGWHGTLTASLDDSPDSGPGLLLYHEGELLLMVGINDSGQPYVNLFRDETGQDPSIKIGGTEWRQLGAGDPEGDQS